MNGSSTDALRSSRSLLWLDRFLRLISVVFVIGTIVSFVALGALLRGSGGVALDATVEPPLVVSLEGGTTIELSRNDEVVDGTLGLETAAVRAKLRLDEDDTDSRWVFAASQAALIAVFWVGLVMMRRIVRSARESTPFDARNASRFRVLGALFVAVPVGAEVSRRVLGSSVEAEPWMRVSIASPDWGVFVLVALGLLALAEIFREGTALRDLEDSTV